MNFVQEMNLIQEFNVLEMNNGLKMNPVPWVDSDAATQLTTLKAVCLRPRK
jgi:hypothetical protein